MALYLCVRAVRKAIASNAREVGREMLGRSFRDHFNEQLPLIILGNERTAATSSSSLGHINRKSSTVLEMNSRRGD